MLRCRWCSKPWCRRPRLCPKECECGRQRASVSHAAAHRASVPAPVKRGRAKHARALVLGEDPHQRPHGPPRFPFVPGGSADTRNDGLKNVKLNPTAISSCTLSRGRQEPWKAALSGLSAPCPGGTRRPHSLGARVRGSYACRLHLLRTEIRVEKTDLPSHLDKCQLGTRWVFAAGAFVAGGGGRVSLPVPSAFSTSKRAIAVASVSCGSWWLNDRLFPAALAFTITRDFLQTSFCEF